MREWSECVAPLVGTRATIRTDGGAWPHNPGHGGLGVVVLSPDGIVVRLEWGYLGSPVSSNEAEYEAVWRALEIAEEMGLTHVDIRSDSQLVVRQLNGEWDILSAKFAGARETFKDRTDRFQKVTLEWIPREQNELANSLVTIVRGQDWGSVILSERVDGRDALGAFLIDLFNRNDIETQGYTGGYIYLAGCLVRPLPFYHREAGVCYPSVERIIFEEAKKRRPPVIFAWRPQGMHAEAMTMEQIGRMPREVVMAQDDRVEPLFAFAGDLAERVPGGRKILGYRGSRVVILEGPWRTTQEFFWWRKAEL